MAEPEIRLSYGGNPEEILITGSFGGTDIFAANIPLWSELAGYGETWFGIAHACVMGEPWHGSIDDAAGGEFSVLVDGSAIEFEYRRNATYTQSGGLIKFRARFGAGNVEFFRKLGRDLYGYLVAESSYGGTAEELAERMEELEGRRRGAA